MLSFNPQRSLNQVGGFGRTMVPFVQFRQAHEGIDCLFILPDHTLKVAGRHRIMPELLATTAGFNQHFRLSHGESNRLFQTLLCRRVVVPEAVGASKVE